MRARAMRACVVFDTRYGNTEKIARAFGAGLGGAGVQTACLNTTDVTPESLGQYDLICIGAPTEWHTSSKPMKEFLRSLKGADLAGKYAFAFDTKLRQPLSGSAAKFIEKELKRLGFEILAPRESATVHTTARGVAGATLEEGEEQRFGRIGASVGGALARATPPESNAPAEAQRTLMRGSPARH